MKWVVCWGAPLAALGLGAGIARYAPLDDAVALAWGQHLVVPLWVTLMCVLPLQKSVARAWLVCLGCAAPGLVGLAQGVFG